MKRGLNRDKPEGHSKCRSTQAKLTIHEEGTIKAAAASAGSRLKGHPLIDRGLCLPKQWATDVERCEVACIPDEVEFTTRPKIAIEMVVAAPDAGVPCARVPGGAF